MSASDGPRVFLVVRRPVEVRSPDADAISMAAAAPFLAAEPAGEDQPAPRLVGPGMRSTGTCRDDVIGTDRRGRMARAWEAERRRRWLPGARWACAVMMFGQAGGGSCG